MIRRLAQLYETRSINDEELETFYEGLQSVSKAEGKVTAKETVLSATILAANVALQEALNQAARPLPIKDYGLAPIDLSEDAMNVVASQAFDVRDGRSVVNFIFGGVLGTLIALAAVYVMSVRTRMNRPGPAF